MFWPFDCGGSAAPPPVNIAICVAMSGAPVVLTDFFFTMIVLLTGSGFDDCAGVKPAIVLGPIPSKRDSTFAAAGCFDFPIHQS